jgi:hypothetical protein
VWVACGHTHTDFNRISMWISHRTSGTKGGCLRSTARHPSRSFKIISKVTLNPSGPRVFGHKKFQRQSSLENSNPVHVMSDKKRDNILYFETDAHLLHDVICFACSIGTCLCELLTIITAINVSVGRYMIHRLYLSNKISSSLHSMVKCKLLQWPIKN